MSAFGSRDIEEFTARLQELRVTLEPPPADPGRYVAYTDGACFGNPSGPGGWAAAVISTEPAAVWHLFGHLSSTSNNRAEALGVLGALEWVPAGSKLTIHSDSELSVRLLQGRYKIKSNTDIWELILRVRGEKQLDLEYVWVRGHVGDPLNELADRLSKLGAMNGGIEDLGNVPEAVRPSEPAELVGLVPKGDWERDFLSSVTQQLRRGRALSPKQQAIVDRMRQRSAEA